MHVKNTESLVRHKLPFHGLFRLKMPEEARRRQGFVGWAGFIKPNIGDGVIEVGQTIRLFTQPTGLARS